MQCPSARFWKRNRAQCERMGLPILGKLGHYEHSTGNKNKGRNHRCRDQPIGSYHRHHMDDDSTGSSNDSAASKQPAKAPVSEHVLDKRSVTKLDNAVQDAVELNRESFRASFNARPSYQTDETGKRKTMAILDTDSSPWDAGTYQLTVYCMGSGTLNASFSIGEQYEDCTVSCTDDIAQETLTIRTEGASEGQVSIVPSEDSVSEIAYWINHPNN